jgi:hypothetical protein
MSVDEIDGVIVNRFGCYGILGGRFGVVLGFVGVFE